MARSRWGWGDESQVPALAEVAARVGAFLGEVTEERASDAVRVPPARVEVPRALRDFAVLDDETRARHAMGKAYPDRVRGFRGDHSSAPDLVAFPRSPHEVATVLEACEAARLAVVPFGGGSSVVGGVEPTLGPGHRGSVSLDTSALVEPFELDATSRLAHLGGGLFGPALEAKLGAHGFTLRHYPQSFEFSTLGGWIVTRAGGHFATGPTHIDELVSAVNVVTPRGALATRTLPATGAGIDPVRLFCGSEGRLGVVTSAWMRVRPRPVFRAQASLGFEAFDGAVRAACAVAQSGLFPSNCRVLDAEEAFINAVADRHVLVLGFESADHAVGPLLERAVELARACGGALLEPPTVKDDREAVRSGAADSWRASFLKGPYLQDALIRLGVLADTFETACPWNRVPELVGQVKAAVQSALERVCGAGLVSCRFTHVYPDGAAPYFTFLGPARRGAELEQWAELKAVATDAVLKHGGTVTHHHAVGRTHRAGYQREVPELVRGALRAAARSVDPAGVLNPGVLFDD
ncbi:MAG: FAD-binding oxidoreductase [Myxococcaceae bacterium]|nr:FAD-binding oxidoreductase [Myxococcaceae bacterium]